MVGHFRNGKSNKPKIAFIRGPFVNKTELYPIELLNNDFAITVVGSPNVKAETALPIAKRICVGSLFDHFPKKWVSPLLR